MFSDVITFSDVNNGTVTSHTTTVYKHVNMLDFYFSNGTDKGVWIKIC